MFSVKYFTELIPRNLRTTLALRSIGLTKVPLLFLTSPKVLNIDQKQCAVLIPYRKIVKNHLGSIYFGALAIGADTCIGALAMDKIFATNKKIDLIFKTFQINFLKRAETDAIFFCDEGLEIEQMIEDTLRTGERVSKPIRGRAECSGETVAEFTLTLSLKYRGKT